MIKNKILITSHSLGEAITKCVIDNQNYFDVPITVVSLQELITDYTIFDELTDSGSVIRWNKGSDFCISNKDHYLLNRVLYVPNVLFNDFISHDQEYAQREFEAYLGFSFNAFVGVGNKSAKGEIGDVLSLPQQWASIRNKFEINVPNYYWGPSYRNSLKNMNNVVYSSIYHFMNWSISNSAQVNKHIFCFEKPPGNPVFILSIGGKQLITSNVDLSINMEDRLLEIAKQIALIFNYFISEILMFVDGDNLYFGCINHEIIRSNKNSSYDQFVCENLINEFFKCIN